VSKAKGKGVPVRSEACLAIHLTQLFGDPMKKVIYHDFKPTFLDDVRQALAHLDAYDRGEVSSPVFPHSLFTRLMAHVGCKPEVEASVNAFDKQK
jgi:hypothetical protein